MCALRALPAAAHMKADIGSLIDLARRSDAVMVGEVQEMRPLPDRRFEVVATNAAAILGPEPGKVFTFRSTARFEPGVRQVFFLIRAGEAWDCLQQRGAVYPAAEVDDALYRQVIEGIRRARELPDPSGLATLRAALTAGLTAAPLPLRYHCALDLLSTVHPDHPLTAAEVLRLQQLLRSPGFDPELAALLAPRLTTPPVSPSTLPTR